MRKYLQQIYALMALILFCAGSLFAAADNAKAISNQPLSYFSQKSIEGVSTMKVTATDVGVSNITFKNPYNPSANQTTWAGYFKGTIDNNAAKFYCIDISHGIAFWTTSQPHTYTDNGSTPVEITYILNNYYPFKSLPYTGGLDASNEAAAVQLAIWHFSDGLDATTITNSTLKTRALAIISDAVSNSNGFVTLTTFAILPATQTVAASTSGIFKVQALDATGTGYPNLAVTLTTTSGTLSASSTTTGSTGLTPNLTLAQGSSTQATVTAFTSYTIPQGTKYEHSVSPNSYQKLVLATPTTANRQAQGIVNWNTQSTTCSMAGFATYTQGGWGSPSNSTPGALRDAKFSLVFPNGMTLGGTKTAKFTTAAALNNFLPAGGTASSFTTNYIDPTSTTAGVFGGQLAALAMNVYFNDAGYLGSNQLKLGQLVITQGPLLGKTVYELLNYANTAIGGGTTSYTIAELNTAADNVNNNFDNGTVDQGFLTCPAQQPVTIGDKVWIDVNKNGLQDNGELGMANVTVQLYDCNNNLKATTTTDASGIYQFSNVTPGSYYIKVTLPANYSFTLANQGSDDSKDSDVDPSTGKSACAVFTSGAVDLRWDAGIYYNKANLGDRVWNDADADGIQDDATAEPGISGVTVTLYDCNNTLITYTVTDANGNYSFINLTPGSYYILVTKPTGFTFSAKNQGSDQTKDSDVDPSTGKSACVTLAAGETNSTVDAGMFATRANIGDRVWNDLNKNGLQDAGETGLANVTVQLYDCNNNLKSSTTTDTAGLYRFTDIVPGDYYIKFTLPANYSFTLKNQGSDPSKDSDADLSTGKTTCTTLANGETDLTWDAGMYFNKATLGDRIWNDFNENGIQDNGEAGVANMPVKLYDCSSNGLITSTITDQNGNYLFTNLTPGNYYVLFTSPGGYIFSAKNQGSDVSKDSDVNPATGKTDCITLAAGDYNLTVDAGVHIQKAAIGDLVWKDLNQNGIQDSGEPGIGGVIVKLFDCNNNFIGMTTTTNDGLYNCIDLPAGDYYVQFILPAGYTFSPKNQGSDVTKDSDVDPLTGKTVCITLAPGDKNFTVDAGMYVPKASVGNKVWNDLNMDGTQDNPVAELGMPNVVVKLFSCSGTLVFTTTTDNNGSYLFENLTPGEYYIQYVLPSGYAFTKKNFGPDTTIDSDADLTTGKTSCFTLTPGMNDLTRDAGCYLNRVSVGDFVWKDLDRDGIQDNGEAGLASVTVRLFDCDNNVIATTVTNSSGYYSFTNLVPGSYYVQFYVPTGYSFSPKNAGNNTSLDSDADPVTGKTSCTTLQPGQDVITWDCGMYETNSTYSDLKITKTTDKPNAQNNDIVTYTVTVTNLGPNSATGVTVSDVLPEGLDYISSSPSGQYDPQTGVWTVGSIANGASATLQIQVKINVTNLNNTVVDLGPAKDFNMFVIEDMDVPSSDTQGKLAVGRDAHLQGYSVGDQLPNSNGAEDVLVVGRDLIFLTGRVYNGNVVYGNQTNLPKYSVSIEEGSLRKGSPIDFAAASTYLNNLSTQLSAQLVNGTTTYQTYNEVTMVGTDPFLNVFTVDGAKLSTANNTSITVPDGSVILVNVTGQKVSWGYGLSVTGTSYNSALFNFYEADSLYIHGIDVTGSVLAPKANVYFQAGVQHGQMVCKSYHGQGQLNLDPFVGNLPVSKDIINVAEVRTSDQFDPNSTPGNGSPSENDYAKVVVHIGVTAPSSPNFRLISNITGNDGPLTITNNASGQFLSGTANGQVLLSTNAGVNWTNINSNMSVNQVWTLTTGTAKSSSIIAGTSNGVYVTNNNGSTWNQSNLQNVDVRDIITSATGTLYAAAWDGGVYQSVNNGMNWTAMNTGLTNLKVNSLHLDNNGDLLAATFGGGIMRYSVLNSTWVAIPIDYKFIWTIHSSLNGVLYAATYGNGVYRSVDGGSTWNKMNEGLTNLYIYSVAEDLNNNIIAISWSGGVFTTSHGTNRWTALGLDGAEISAVHINSVGGTILVGTKTGSIFSKNGPLDVKETSDIPTEFNLSQNYPNPFNPSTKINFSLPSAGHVTLTVYNILGQQISKLIDEEYNPGSYTVNFDGKNLATGIYIYRLSTKNFTMTKKMLLVK